jgi:hypothetical protein
MTLLPYSKEDYFGDYNLLASEKRLIAKAYIDTKGDLKRMSVQLGMKPNDLLYKIVRHFNISTF